MSITPEPYSDPSNGDAEAARPRTCGSQPTARARAVGIFFRRLHPGCTPATCNRPATTRYPSKLFGPGASREAIRARIKGATLPRSRTVLLIAGNLRDLREAWAVLGQEVLAHHGLNLFPPEIKQQILERIAGSRGMPGMDAFFRQVERDEPHLAGTRQAEEVFGRIIEQGAAWLARPAKGFEHLHKPRPGTRRAGWR